jgi:hypothetical protein
MLEGEGRLIVCVELPGLAASEITIEVTDEGLILEGEKRPEPEARRGSVFRTERAYGSFRRVIPLPQGARGEEARARFENGVLKVWIPAPEVTRRRLRVPIENAPPRAAAPAWEFEGPDAALPPREVGPSPATGPALHPPGAREGHAPEPPDARPGSTGAGLASAAATVPSEGQVGTRVRG